jgi:hypothetical protein
MLQGCTRYPSTCSAAHASTHPTRSTCPSPLSPHTTSCHAPPPHRWEESDTDSDVHETTRATRARIPLIPPIPNSPAPSEALSEASTAQLDPSPAPRSSGHHSKPHQPPQRPPMSGSTPVHTSSRFSYLSSDGVWAAKHEGLFNLGMVILLAANCRLILENLMKYGLRLHMLRWGPLLVMQEALMISHWAVCLQLCWR